MTDNFFAQKREWSVLKDQILDHYLTPYLSKIVTTGRPTRIADCFAGKGRFDDGNPGSPIIIAEHIAQVLSHRSGADLKGVFIESKYVAELMANLHPYANCEVLSGDYENCIKYFIDSNPDANRNYFLFIDPYGVKSISFSHFNAVKKLGLASVELLLNLNTTGFLREGCRLLGLNKQMPEWADDSDYEQDGKNSPAHMDDIAGGNYWRDILGDFQEGKLSFHEAEECFTRHYKNVLSGIFKYVVDIPIKERSHHMPKYRLVFGGDNQHGLLLMADEMNKAWRTLLKEEQGGQLYLFGENELAATQSGAIQDLLWEELSSPLELGELLSRLVIRHGIAYSTSQYKAAVKQHERQRFTIAREPPLTPTGKTASSMDQNQYGITIDRLSFSQDLL